MRFSITRFFRREYLPTTTYNYYTGVISDWLRRHGYTEAEIGSIFFRYELENINPGSR